MKTIYLYISIAIFGISFSSCGEDFFSTTLDIDAPTPEDILVTHAFLNIDDNQLALWVSGTENILNSSFDRQQLEGSQVTLKDDLDNTFSLDLSITNIYEYEINSINSEANEISITTEAPGYDEKAIARQQIIPKTVIKSFEFIEDGGLNTEGDERSAIEIVFDDPAGVENYYEVFISLSNNSPDDLRSTYTNSNDPIVTKGHDFYSVIFDDSTFDGQTKNINFSLFRILESNAKDRMFITWRNISKDYFQFTKTYKAFEEQEDNPFATPVQVYSNFENGHGIFSAYREQLIPVF